ncbi:MAG: hypothetical protein HZC54_12195 [Verrucomicrobia bacterium]|nr:hypothetical protein [Verrucomicrobiota bacterium]
MNRFIVMAVAAVTLAAGGTARAADTLAEDEAAIAKHIQTLHDPSNEVREAAAKSLREIVAKYGNGTSNIREKDAGEARWQEKVSQIIPGMTKAEALNVLRSPEFSNLGGFGSGQSHSESYRLDSHWTVTIQYRNPDKVLARPTLSKKESGIYVTPPAHYTGTWNGWYVNGQKRDEMHFKDGKYDGVCAHYHDNGEKSYEQHYVNHVIDGPDTGWYRDGKKMYVGQYRKGKQHGQWIHWYSDGQKQAERNYKDGTLDGFEAGWNPNGQKRFEHHYKDGVRINEAAWNEQGVLQYKREYKDGKLVK